MSRVREIKDADQLLATLEDVSGSLFLKEPESRRKRKLRSGTLVEARKMIDSSLPNLSLADYYHPFGIYSPGHIVREMVKYAQTRVHKHGYDDAVDPLEQAQKMLRRPDLRYQWPASNEGSPPASFSLPFFLRIPGPWLAQSKGGKRFLSGLYALESRRDQKEPTNLLDLRVVKEMSRDIENCHRGQVLIGDKVREAPHAKNLIGHLLGSIYSELLLRQGFVLSAYSPVALRLQLIRGIISYSEQLALDHLASQKTHAEQPLILPMPEGLRITPPVMPFNLRSFQEYRASKSVQNS